MFELIARLRSRPLEYRRRIAFFTALGMTLLIIALWLVSLFVHFDNDPQETARVAETPGPFETFFQQTQAGISSFGDMFKAK